MSELRISDIGRHWPQIGPFSRDGWSHPGPALFYALLLPFRLTGSHSNGLLVGAALINALAVGGMVLLARRWGGRSLALFIALGSLILVIGLGLTFAWNPWNPFLPVLPFGLAVIAAWCVVCGDKWCLTLLVVVGSFCAQTHVGYVPLVVALFVVAGLGFTWHLRTVRRAGATKPSTSVRTPMLVAIAVFVLCWTPPLFQQLHADPGNLSAIWSFFRSGRAAHSLGDGFDVVTAQFAWNPGWLVGRTDLNPFTAEPLTLSHASLPVWWVALGAALLWTWTTSRRVARALGAVLVVMIASSVVAIARTLGTVYEYRLRFVWLLGMLTAAYSVWVLALAVATRVHRPRQWARAGTAVAVVGILGLSAYGVTAAASTDPPRAHESRVITALMPQLLRRLPNAPGVVIPGVRTLAEFPYQPGLMVELERRGIPVRMHDNLDDRLRYGDHRALGAEPVRAELRIALDDQIERVQQLPCARMLAYWGAVRRTLRQRAVTTASRIRRALVAHRLAPRDAFRRLQRLSENLSAVAVFQVGCPRGG